MTPALTDILCTSCGLCCDGTLLADVELGGKDDLVALEILGLEIEDADDDWRARITKRVKSTDELPHQRHRNDRATLPRKSVGGLE